MLFYDYSWHIFFLQPIAEGICGLQHVTAIGPIKNHYTGSYFAINLVNFLASKLIQHVIAIGSTKNLDTVTFGEKVLTLAMSRGTRVRGYGI